MERCTVFAFLDADFITAIRHKLREPKRTARRQPHRSALEVYSQERPTRHHVLPPPHYFSEKVGVDCCVLYLPEVEEFPLLDAFFLNSPRNTLVGLQMTTAGAHHTITSTVKQFTECLAAYFKGWNKLSRDMSWEIIYVQHAASKMISKWQGCDVDNSDNVSRAESRENSAFWKEKGASTKCQYYPETFEGTKHSAVWKNRRNRKTNWGGKGAV
ncbi:putative retrotransposon hot spot (RHS) protein [Trypanosoma cruzi]|uniref:Putative retrotransposon hot spot (RHS) protein n=1 Tax=Trypanosoma cruzi TaxID=5693 RepID=A0A2V2V8F1_TRYCR|nr:putative retrotransposon hot spot (RHS) protein [Trypanosoma cruzi]